VTRKLGAGCSAVLCCSPAGHSCSSEGISFPYEPAVELEDNGMACSSSISAFIYEMMSLPIFIIGSMADEFTAADP
jgi:hypothetical protein